MNMGKLIATVVIAATACAYAGRWDAERAEWKRFCETFEPDYSDGSKYLHPKEGNRFDEPFALVKDGKPAAKVVWQKGPWYADDLSTDVTGTAVSEFVALVKMITGVELPVFPSPHYGPDMPAVLVGKACFFPYDQTVWRQRVHAEKNSRLTPTVVETVNGDLKALRGTDGFAIHRFGRDIAVYGCSEKGALNGVYALIENNTDIIFTRTDEKVGTVYSERPGELSLVWGADVREKPSMEMRGFWNQSIYPWRRYWNANYCTTSESRQWSDERFFTRGGHNAGDFVPPASERPDLHGLVSGKRGDYGYMLCFSNPDLPAVYRESVLRYMDQRQPSRAAGLDIGLDDTMNWCECENCAKPLRLPDGRALERSDPAFMCTQWFLLLNDSARALAAEYPGMKIDTLAYFQTAPVPACEVAENIVVGFCPYMRANDLAPVYAEENEIWIDRFEGWARKLPDRRRLYIRGYDGLGLLFPRPLCHTHQRDWRLFAKGACGIKHEGSDTARLDGVDKDGKPTVAANVFDYSAIEFWVMCRLMWDLDADVEQLYKKFCWRTYREAAPAMERFYGTIRRDFLRRGLPSTIGEDGSSATKIYIVDGGREQELRGYLDEALAKARHPKSRVLVERVKARFEHFVSEVRNAKTSSLSVPLVVRGRDAGFDDADWKTAAVIDRLYEPQAANAGRDVEGAHPARIELTHDGKALSLRATFWEDMSKIVSSKAKPGSEEVYGSSFEAFFTDNSSPDRYYLFRMDNAGNVADYIGYDDSWNRRGTTTAVRKYDDRWVLLMKVPLEEIGMDIIRDNVLKAAFIRVRPIQGSSSKMEYTSWKFNRFHKPATFGTLTLQR